MALKMLKNRVHFCYIAVLHGKGSNGAVLGELAQSTRQSPSFSPLLQEKSTVAKGAKETPSKASSQPKTPQKPDSPKLETKQKDSSNPEPVRSGGGCNCILVSFLLCIVAAFVAILLVPQSGDPLSQMPVAAQLWLEGAIVDFFSSLVICSAAGQMVPVHDGREVLQIYARVVGSLTSSETLLLIPDLFSSSFTFRDFVDQLDDKYRIVTFDFPGTGLSHAPTSHKPASSVYLTELIASLTESLQMRPAHIVAHASSARVALDFAIKYPSRVRSITFVAANPSSQAAFRPSSALKSSFGKQVMSSLLGGVALQTYLQYHGASLLTFEDAQAYAFFFAHSNGTSPLNSIVHVDSFQTRSVHTPLPLSMADRL
jgi:pimeloyl-ACP methyl ester carboxylesterase